MSNLDGFDRLITAWLDELAPMREPDGLLESVTGQMQRTRRLPGWALLERWLPMQTRAKFGADPRTAIILVTLGIVAALVTAVAIGAQPSSKSDLAPLFGVAGNGRVFSDSSGDIYVTDPGSNSPQPFVTNPQFELYPTMTNDGSRLIYQRNDGSKSVLMSAAADGSDEPRQLAGEFATLEEWWPSPDGTLPAASTARQSRETASRWPAPGDATRPRGWDISRFMTAQGTDNGDGSG